AKTKTSDWLAPNPTSSAKGGQPTARKRSAPAVVGRQPFADDVRSVDLRGRAGFAEGGGTRRLAAPTTSRRSISTRCARVTRRLLSRNPYFFRRCHAHPPCI